MKTIKAIEERRSIRKYKEKEIKKDIIEDILNAGRLAPSAKNRQPWFFVVLSTELKNKIADLMINLKQEEGKEGDYTYSSSLGFTGKVVKEAKVMVLVYTYENEEYLISDTLSLGASIENMLLRATELSIGSLWVRDTTHVEDEINKLLNINDKKLSSAVLLGYPNQSPKQRPRKELKDITMWIE